MAPELPLRTPLQGYEEAEREHSQEIRRLIDASAAEVPGSQAMHRAAIGSMQRVVLRWVMVSANRAVRSWREAMKDERRGQRMAVLHSTMMIDQSDDARANRQGT